MSTEQFLAWFREHPKVQSIPVVIHTGAVMVNDEVKKAVRAIFFKSNDPQRIRSTVQEMCDLAFSE
jgi:hypothetical protein